MNVSLTKIAVIVSVLSGLNLSMPLKSIPCPIPVFRYALEYWEPDAYSLEIIYDEPLTPEEEEMFNSLVQISSDSEIKANLKVQKIDARSNTNPLPDNHFPLMVLRYPRISGIKGVLWSAPLNSANIEVLLQSPVRSNVGEKLVKDATAVWIFLESGDRKKDRAALAVLEKELEHLEKTLVLTDPELWWGDLQDVEDGKIPPLKFDIITVSRTDPGEACLVKMLLGSEDDLKAFESEPIVFPVFGRGIVLYGIVGKGINEWNIREAAEFITGDCSCQAKAGNPGTDLLIALDWDRHVRNLTDISRANPLSGIGDFTNREKEVRRSLELATMKRMGSVEERGESLETASEKVVYLNLFSENNRASEEVKTVTENGEEKSSTPVSEEENEPGELQKQKKEEVKTIDPDNAGESNFENTDSRDQGKSGLNHMVIMTLAGLVLLVFLGGIIIYIKAS